MESNKKIKGWVTYTCNDKFIEGVICLKKSLVRVKSQYELYCMVTEGVTKKGRENLKINGIRLIDIEKIHIKRTEGIKDRYSENSWMMFSKFNLWRLTQFDSLVYLDADLIFIKNADELISQISLNENVSFAACPHIGGDEGIQAGMMFIRPSLETFKDILEKAESTEYDNTHSDQGFINWYFRKNNSWNKIPEIYNVLQKKASLGTNFDNVKIYHYNGQKPWINAKSNPEDSSSWKMGENIEYIYWKYVYNLYNIKKEKREKQNACIALLSSREKSLKLCLENIWNNFNNKYDYPVYVYYFDDIYDDEDFRKEITSRTKQNVIFKSVPYSSPANVKEEEMFYNRKDNWYAKNSFSINRKGYLHMLNFKTNMFNYENTEFNKYEYSFLLDDESGFTKEIDFDPFKVMIENDIKVGCFFTKDRNRTPSKGQICTTVNLWETAKRYIEENNIQTNSSHIKKLFSDPEADVNINKLPIIGMRLIKHSLFKTKEWLEWVNMINSSGSIYKLRWGDDDIYTLFCLINEIKVKDMNDLEGECFDSGFFRSIQDIAPNVKEKDK